jgi:Mg-chelatase subunit ChlD
MSHSLGAVAVSPEGDRYVNDVVVGRNLPIPAENTRSYLHATHDGRNDRLEVYLTQGESPDPVDCTVLGKYVFHGITPSAAEVAVDVRVSYDANGTVQVEATQRDTGRGLPLTIEPVPEDLSWLAGPPGQSVEASPPEPVRIYLLMDVSSSMSGPPLEEAQAAAREFLAQCDFTAAEVGLISFSTDVTLQAEATSNARKLQSAIARLDADGTTNLADALTLAHRCLASRDRTRYVVVLTDGFPDAAESAVEEAQRAIADDIQIIAIGTGEADRDYLSRIASTESGSLFARRGELVRTFGHIARVIAEGGRGLRVMS